MTKDAKETKGRADHIDHLVSRRLRMRRMMLGLSQGDLGEAVRVSIQQIQKYEKATNRISSGKLHAFSQVLKVPVNYFFDQSEDSGNTLGTMFAEEGDKYESGENDDENIPSEKEIISLIKAFMEVKSSQSRKKIIELVKTMT